MVYHLKLFIQILILLPQSKINFKGMQTSNTDVPPVPPLTATLDQAHGQAQEVSTSYNCISSKTADHFCLFLFLSVSLCLLLSAIVSFNLFLSVFVCFCLFLSQFLSKVALNISAFV